MPFAADTLEKQPQIDFVIVPRFGVGVLSHDYLDTATMAVISTAAVVMMDVKTRTVGLTF